MDLNNPAIEQKNYSAVNEVKMRLSLASVFLVCSGLFLIVWASLSGYFRDDENILTAGFCLPLAVGFALILNGSLINSRLKTFAFWSGLLLVGQAATLQMIDAGRLIHFQHYRSFKELINEDFLFLLIFLLQIGFVLFGISERFGQIRNWFDKNFARWQLLLIALFLTISGAAVTPNISIYLTDLFFAAVVQFVNLANIGLAVLSVPKNSISALTKKLDRFFSESKNGTIKLDRFSVIAAVWVVVLAGTLSYFVYENHPHVPDETQYLFQARNMTAGQLTSAPPLVPEAFAMYMVPYSDDRWYGIFPPAYPAILAAGMTLGAQWLVNPLLAGLCVLLTYIFFQQIYSRRFARIGVLLLCCAPWFVFMAMSFMSHIFTLFCALTAAVLLNKSIAGKKIFYAFGAGLFIGIVSLIRPLDGLIVALLLGVWTLFSCKSWREKITTSVALVLGTIVTASIIFPYNKAITGSAALLPMDAYYAKYFWKDVMALGFGANRGIVWGIDAFPGHSPFEALINAALNIFSLNVELLGWGCGSLLLTIFLILTGRLRKKDFWAVGAVVLIVGCYSLYWYSGGPDFGARYWFLCIIPLIALTVRGIEAISKKFGDSEFNPRIILAVFTLCAASLLCYLPWRATDKYFHYLEMQPGIRELTKNRNFGRSLVLIRGQEHPDYQSAWIYNPLNFEGDAPIFAWDKNEEIRHSLLSAYSDRQVWIVEGPTRTESGYKIVQGPISSEKLLLKH